MRSAKFQRYAFAKLEKEKAPDDVIARLRSSVSRPRRSYVRQIWSVPEREELLNLFDLDALHPIHVNNESQWRKAYVNFLNRLRSADFKDQVLGKLDAEDVPRNLDSKIRRLLLNITPRKLSSRSVST